MSAIAELERKRLKPIFQAGGVGKAFKKNKKGKYYFTQEAKKFIGAQAFDKKNQYLPAGTVWDETKQSIVARNTILDKKGRLLKRLQKKGLTFKKKERTIQYKGQGFMTGSIRVELMKPGAKNIEIRQQGFDAVPYTNTKEAEQRIKEQLLPLVISEAERQFVVSVKVINPVIIRNGKSTPDIGDIKLRRAFLKLDGYNTDGIDKHEFQCFRDAFMYRYENDKNINKDALDPEVWDLFFSERDENYKKEGISCNDFKDWCQAFDIPMVIVQDDEVPIINYYPRVTDEVKEIQAKFPMTFVGCMRDGHIYLQTNQSKIDSASHRVKNHGGIMVHKTKNSKTREELNLPITYLDIHSNRMDVVAKELKTVEECRHQKMCDIMEEEETNVLSTNIRYRDNQLQEFVLKNKRYVFDDENKKLIRKCAEFLGQEYKGLTPIEMVVCFLKNENIPTSFCNPEINKLLLDEKVKDRTHVGGVIATNLKPGLEDILYANQEYLKKRYENENIKTFDIPKCHTDILENYPSTWIIFEPKDEIQKYEPVSTLRPGLYFVETDDRKLFTGNNWCDHYYVTEGLNEKIITHENIKYQIISTKPQSKYLYTNLIKGLKEMCKPLPVELGKPLCKLLCNMVSGCAGKTATASTKHYLSWNKQEMERHLIHYADKRDHKVFSYPVKRGNETFYHYGHRIIGARSRHNLPHYLQILGLQNILTYRYIKKMTNNDWSKVLYRRCDAFTVIDGPSPKSKIYKQLVTNKPGMLRLEENPLKPVQKPYYDVEIADIQRDWDIKEMYSYDYQQLIDLVESGKSAMITAPGGYGKTYMIYKLMEKYPDEEHICCAWMNTHAYRIQGKTLHKQFGLSMDETKIHKNRLNYLKKSKTKVIIVDEIGTLDGELWTILYEIKANCPDISILCFGSFKQLKPIDRGNYEDHSLSHIVCEGRRYKLQYHDKCRCNIPLKQFLHKIDTNDFNQIDKMMRTLPKINKFVETNIVATNEYRHKLNYYINKAMSTLHDTILYKSDLLAKDKNGEKYSCYLYEGCKFIGVETDNEDEKYFNGERFKCIKFDDDTITLLSFLRKDHIIQIPYREMEKFDLSYALTCHKVQGDTLEGPVMIHQYKKGFEHDNNWIRTAVERPKQLNQIFLPDDNLKFMLI
jgi:hypothetical protein